MNSHDRHVAAERALTSLLIAQELTIVSSSADEKRRATDLYECYQAIRYRDRLTPVGQRLLPLAEDLIACEGNADAVRDCRARIRFALAQILEGRALDALGQLRDG